MNQISLTSDLERRGVSRDEIRTQLRTGELVRIRRGAYAAPTAIAAPSGAERTRRHRLLIDAATRQLSDQFVVSHMSAALLLGLPIWSSHLSRVQFTRGQPGGGKTRRDVVVHGVSLASDEIVDVGGLRVTSAARTVLDLSCSLRLEEAVAIGDAALRQGLDPAELAGVVARAGGRTGAGRARRAVGILDPRSESPGESVSRVTFLVCGLPEPELQYRVFEPDGTLAARTDTAWEEFRTLGEFDGEVKYGRLLKPGQQPGDVVFDEKVREDRLRSLGWEVVRWTWRDLQRPDELVRRIEAAFERGRRR